MRTDYSTLPHITLMPGSSHARSEEPRYVSMDSPALTVMTDLKETPAVTIPPDALIDDALERMKSEGVRMLLVVAPDEEIIGLVTAKDIQGERPIMLVREGGLARAKITVRQIMIPQASIDVITMDSLSNAQVGHVVATMRVLERQHALVVEVDEVTRAQVVRGVISTSTLRKQIGRDVDEIMTGAHSLAELQHTVGGAD